MQLVIEGNDGSGKSTLIKNLKKYYRSKKYRVVVIRYNMSYVTLPAIKEGKKRFFSPEVNTLLHFLSIHDQIDRIISKKKKETIFIWDRYIYSVCARGKTRNISDNTINYCLSRIPKVDCTILLNIDPEEAYKRLNFNANYWESGLDINKGMNKKESFLLFQSETYYNLCRYIKRENIKYIIDSSISKEKLFFKVISIINKEINKNGI